MPAAYVATKHLVDLGHRRIAHVAFASKVFEVVIQRRAGYEQALMDGGRPEAAIDQYHECAKALKQHYDTEPETVMIEYFHRARMMM